MANRYLRRARGRTGASGHARPAHLHTFGRSLGMPGRGGMCPPGPSCVDEAPSLPSRPPSHAYRDAYRTTHRPGWWQPSGVCAAVLASDPHAVLAPRLGRPSPPPRPRAVVRVAYRMRRHPQSLRQFQSLVSPSPTTPAKYRVACHPSIILPSSPFQSSSGHPVAGRSLRLVPLCLDARHLGDLPPAPLSSAARSHSLLPVYLLHSLSFSPLFLSPRRA